MRHSRGSLTPSPSPAAAGEGSREGQRSRGLGAKAAGARPGDLTEAARELRHWQTPAEVVLWQELRGRKLAGLKFRRQQPLGPYIVDFYCLEHRLIIELDGPIHDAQPDYDAERTGYLESQGCTVLRFPNDEVFTNLSAVLEQIHAAALRLPSPAAAGEGEG